MSSFNTFEGLDDTITRLNKRLADDPIPGSYFTTKGNIMKLFFLAHLMAEGSQGELF